jgi:uncharacterized lipoprotein YbaY
VTQRIATRGAIAVVSALLVAVSLAGCARGTADGQSARTPTTTTTTAAPAGAGESGSSLSDIQNDLNSADSATSNADGDVADADQSAATNDSP